MLVQSWDAPVDEAEWRAVSRPTRSASCSRSAWWTAGRGGADPVRGRIVGRDRPAPGPAEPVRRALAADDRVLLTVATTGRASRRLEGGRG